MRRILAFTSIAILCSLASLQAQGIGDWGENTDQWQPTKPSTPWSAESLFIGATFLRDTTKDFIVSLIFNEAGCSGDLYVVVPGGAAGGGDTSIYLFNNHDAFGTTVNLTNNPVVRANVHHMDTIWFMYWGRMQGTSRSCPANKRYSGPNRAPSEGWTGTDRFYSVDKTTQTFTSPDGTTHQIGRRWCVAGWIRNAALGSRTDTVEFGFEDLLPGDADYDDVLFHVLGVFLIRPASLVNITLDAQPAEDTINAGESVTYTANVYIDSVDAWGQHYTFLDPYRSSQVTWLIMGDTTGGRLVNGPGPTRSNVFTATMAYRWYSIQATIRDPKTGQILQRVVMVYVRPSAAHHLVVENGYSVATGLNLNRANAVNNITMSGTVIRDSVYAILRDQYENFVSVCLNTGWTVIVRPDVVGVADGRTTLGEGVITKSTGVGTAQVEARDKARPTLALFRDTLNVTVTAVNYTAVRIVNGTGGAKTVLNGQTITINLTEDTLLYAEVHREDNVGGDNNDGWIRLPVQWLLQPSPPLASATPPPGSDSMWLFAPITDTGSGTIRARYTGLADAVVNVRVRTGGPDRLTLYSNAGLPNPANKYLGPNPPDNWMYTWTAGSNYPLYAKIFDPYGIWLSGYETDAALGQYITWTVRDMLGNVDAGAGSFSRTTGPNAIYTPRRAYDTVNVIATFSQGAVTRRDTVKVRVIPGNISQLVIEPTPDSSASLWAPNPINQIVMQNTATTVSVYGMLRDLYGNFVRHADSASWLSRDSLVASAAMGPNWQLGQGLVTRRTSNNDTAQVLATYRGMVDSVMVIVTAVTYDSLRVYVLSGGKQYISSMSIRTDQDTTLYAEGKRSDNALWEPVAVRWTSPGVNLNPDSLLNQISYRFRPAATGSGRVIADRSGTSGTIRDTVALTVLPGLPMRMDIYSQEGNPSSMTPRPDQSTVDTLVAGRAADLVAKLFDQNGAWLSQYESSPANQFVSWRVVEAAGNNLPPTGSLSTTQGHRTSFTPTRAYNTVDIIADYNEPGRTQLSDVVRFYIKPDTAYTLVIEPAPRPTGVKLNEPDKLSQVVFSSTDTIRYAFAVLRDRFGNFVSPSPATNWVSREQDTVDAREGNAANGEGVLIRMARSGSSWVVATNRTRGFLIDSVTVTLQSIYYTALRIVVGDSTDITILQLRIDQDTTLVVQGRRSDNSRWESVPADWGMAPLVATTPGAPQASESWSFSPGDTGSGWIKVTLGTATPDSVRFYFLRGLASYIVLYPDTGRAGANNAAYPDPSTAVVDSAGKRLPLVAKVFDYMGNWLWEYERDDAPVSWSVVELSPNPPTGSLSATTGALSGYTPVRARNEVYVVALFDTAGMRYADTVRVSVVPGRPHHLVIEPDQDWSASPYADNPVDTVRITSNDTYRPVYAIVRDALGNYVSYSTVTQWSSADSAVVTAASGTAAIGEGNIRRVGAQGITTVSAQGTVRVGNADTLFSDNTVVQVLPYYYTALRILDARTMLPITGTDTVYTDDSASYIVQGMRSDTTLWENVAVGWDTSGNLQISPAPPERSERWTYSPVAPGSGLVIVNNGDPLTTPDTIGVVFLPSPASIVEFEVLTPADQLIAGDTIVAVVRIKNQDGLYPGRICYGSVFQDELGASPNGSQPVVIVHNTVPSETLVDTLNLYPDVSVSTNECFGDSAPGGIDTVRFILTYAPVDPDSLHQLYVTVNGHLGVAAPFRLLPGPLDRLVLEYVNGIRVPDALTLYAEQGQSKVFFSRGYDRFGNKRGDENCDWSTTGTLHAASRATNTPRLFYDASLAVTNEAGYVIALAVDTAQGLKADSVYVTIVGPAIRLVQAVTADTNGNGYLDGVLLRFDRPITLPTDPDSLQMLLINLGFDYGSVSWQALDIRVVADSTSPDSAVFFVTLREDSTADPQTAWLPYISLSYWPGVRSIPPGQVQAADGAGPVVWQVIKYVEEGKPDRVVVIFSEPVRDSAGNEINLSTLPSQIFNVYRWNRATSSFEPVDYVLDSLVGLVRVNGDTVIFEMVNNRDLVPGWYLNIKVPAIVADNANVNEPVADNRLVPVTLRGSISLNLKALPNPARGDTRIAGPREFSAGYSRDARAFVLNGGGGIVTSLGIMRPTSGTVKLTRAIYDLAGNLVVQAIEKDLLATVAEAGRDTATTRVGIDVYWNCYNAKGMPAAPGIYREIMYIDYSSAAMKDPPPQYVNYGVVR